MNWLSTAPLDTGSTVFRDYIEYFERSKRDTANRIVAAILTGVILSLFTGVVFPVFWLSLVAFNELFVVLIRRRYERIGHADYRSVFFSTANIFFGTSAWCVATIYLGITGGLGEIILGVALIIGVLTHATFVKIAYSTAVWTTFTAVMATILSIPGITYLRGITDEHATLGVFMAFSTLIFYFTSAARHNFKMRDELNETLFGLSEANERLEEHKRHLYQLVDERTRELREEKMKLTQSLEYERQMNEMQTQFVSTASHEFRTPLAIIDGNARRIERKLQDMDAGDVIDRTDTIRKSVSRLTFLIETMLDSSKVAAGKMVPNPQITDINQILSEIVHRQTEISPDHTIELDLSDSPETIIADPRMLETAFSNILSNAVKYSRSNPRVEIRTQTTPETLQISVKDFGIGIPKKELPEITKRFFRSSNAAGIPGTGIGLNLVQALVEMHNGQLRINSKESEWTDVTITLPIGLASKELSPPKAAAAG